MPPTATPVKSISRRRRQDLSLPVRTWVRLERVFHRIDRRAAENLREWNLSVGRFDILNHAGLNDGATQQELADALLVTKGNITQLLDALECEGLLRREKCGRVNRIHLTDEGRRLRDGAVDSHIQVLTTAMNVLTEEEQQQLGALLRKLERGLNRPA
ncbi:MAG TPA: MarR family transcriptional regulator [Chloroflexota bacterium]|nr:MarR family transcriptional regulator [Chloroflexota bacterium]